MANKTCTFRATVNGQRRWTVITLTEDELDQVDLDYAELMVINNRKAYECFYAGAKGADYGAPLQHRELSIPQSPLVISE